MYVIRFLKVRNPAVVSVLSPQSATDFGEIVVEVKSYKT
jgi:hypothetical protein